MFIDASFAKLRAKVELSDTLLRKLFCKHSRWLFSWERKVFSWKRMLKKMSEKVPRKARKRNGIISFHLMLMLCISESRII
ncbi:MAG: hypothetical protein DRG59_11985 [Deltaproteobacteria bacterium]|nr:MAG: hypothetical protein DRG59_11985 [Deltaproteobacteria bacterium]